MRQFFTLALLAFAVNAIPITEDQGAAIEVDDSFTTGGDLEQMGGAEHSKMVADEERM